MDSMATLMEEYRKAQGDYHSLVQSLTPSERARWNAIVEAHEFFDGEWGIALGYLKASIKDGSLN